MGMFKEIGNKQWSNRRDQINIWNDNKLCENK